MPTGYVTAALCPALSRLRQTTQAQHEQLEAVFHLEGMQTDRKRYIELIQRFHAVYAALETASNEASSLSAWQRQMQQVGLDWSKRQKLPSLVRDLNALGASPLVQRHAPGARPALHTFPEVLGCLYVVEGSTLGGQVICRRLSTHLQLSVDTGMAFFSGYGRKTGLMWRQMRDVLSRQLSDSQSLDEAVRSAQSTFALFHAGLAL